MFLQSYPYLNANIDAKIYKRKCHSFQSAAKKDEMQIQLNLLLSLCPSEQFYRPQYISINCAEYIFISRSQQYIFISSGQQYIFLGGDFCKPLFPLAMQG